MGVYRWNRILEGALLALVVGVHPVLVAIGPRLDQSDAGYLLANILPLSQMLVLLTWSVLGPGPVWLRAFGFPVLLALGSVAWARIWNGREGEVVESHVLQLVLFAAMAGCVLIALRVAGVVIGRGDENSLRGAQFSIAGLLVLTTLVAATIGTLEALRPLLSGDTAAASPIGRYLIDSIEDVVRPQLMRTLTMSAAVAGVALAAMWMVLRSGPVWFRLAMVALCLPALALYLLHASGHGGDVLRERTASLTLAFAALTLVTAGSLLPLRMFGYRLHRRAAGMTHTRSQQVKGRFAIKTLDATDSTPAVTA